jgi:chaperonin GroES
MSKKGIVLDQTITPLGDRVLVEELKQEAKTASGIILPDSYKDDRGMKEGKVIAVGPGRIIDGEMIPVAVKKGDKVFFQWGDELKIGGKEYHLVNESSIVAIIN